MAPKENNIPIFLRVVSYPSGHWSEIPSFPYLNREQRHKIVYGFFAGGSHTTKRKNSIELLPEWEKSVRCIMSYHPDKQFEIFKTLINGSEISKDTSIKISENLTKPFVRDFIEICNIGMESIGYLGMTDQERLEKTIETASKYENPSFSKIMTYAISQSDGFKTADEKSIMSYERKLNDTEFHKYCSILKSVKI